MSVQAYPAYRDSGVDWIGVVPTHWAVCAVNYRYEVALGKMLDEKRITGEFLGPYIRNVHVQWGRIDTDDLPTMDFSGNDLVRYALKVGDLLVCEGGEVGRAALWDGRVEPCFYQKALHRLRPRRPDRDVPKFVFYIMRAAAELGIFEGSEGKATISHLTAETLQRYRFPFPPPAEQSAIAAFLDRETGKIDALVAEQERLMALLKEKRQAVISQAVTKGLNPNAKMKPSGVEWLGEVPEHWEVRRGRQLFVERDHRSETGEETLLTVSHLTGVTPRSEKTVNMIEAESTEGYKRCFPGDLVINTLWAWMGAMGVADVAGIVSPAYHVYTPRSGFEPAYVNAIVRMPQFAREAERWSKGVWSSRLRLYPEEMFQIWFPVPPQEEQAAIAARLEAVIREGDALTAEAERAIALLKERRAALISAAVTGKIDVRDLADTQRDAA